MWCASGSDHLPYFHLRESCSNFHSALARPVVEARRMVMFAYLVMSMTIRRRDEAINAQMPSEIAATSASLSHL